MRRFHVSADRRGVYTLGPVDLSVGDPFARRAATEERAEADTFLVWPRTIPTTELAPTDRWGDHDRAHGPRRGPVAVRRRPAVRAGRPGPPRPRPDERPPQPADAQAIRAVARPGAAGGARRPDVDGPAWELGLADDEVEELYVVAASVVRQLAHRRLSFGFLAAGYTGAETRIARVPVSSSPGQVQRVLDLLARLSVARLGAVRAAAGDRRARASGRGRRCSC